MQEAGLYDELTEIFVDALSCGHLTLTPELTMNDVQGWDSFKQIEIILAVEEKYGIKFGARELDELYCVGDLARTILAKIPGAAAASPLPDESLR
jgi:acyl carrier protein